MLKKSYKPKHNQNRMKNEGQTQNARNNFLYSPSTNLKFLLKNRYEWMNKYITPKSHGVELGCGTGLSKFFIKSTNFLLTDYSEDEWLDVKNVDALKTPFKDNSFDFVVASNMIHHVPYPIKFLKETARILKPGGVLLIQDVNNSLAMRLILRLMRHEGYSYDVNIFNEKIICTDPDDLWSANCAIPNLLFDDKQEFEKSILFFKMEQNVFSEFIIFLNSGGVIAKTFYLPLPSAALRIVKLIDSVLTKNFPGLLSLQRRIVLRKIV